MNGKIDADLMFSLQQCEGIHRWLLPLFHTHCNDSTYSSTEDGVDLTAAISGGIGLGPNLLSRAKYIRYGVFLSDCTNMYITIRPYVAIINMEPRMTAILAQFFFHVLNPKIHYNGKAAKRKSGITEYIRNE